MNNIINIVFQQQHLTYIMELLDGAPHKQSRPIIDSIVQQVQQQQAKLQEEQQEKFKQDILEKEEMKKSETAESKVSDIKKK